MCESNSTLPRSFSLSTDHFCWCFHQFLKMKVFHCVLHLQSILSLQKIPWTNEKLGPLIKKHYLHMPAEVWQKFLLQCVRACYKIRWHTAAWFWYIYFWNILEKSCYTKIITTDNRLTLWSWNLYNQEHSWACTDSYHDSVQCESGYYCKCVRMMHVLSWSNMRRTEQNFIHNHLKYTCSPTRQHKWQNSCPHWARTK